MSDHAGPQQTADIVARASFRFLPGERVDMPAAEYDALVAERDELRTDLRMRNRQVRDLEAERAMFRAGSDEAPMDWDRYDVLLAAEDELPRLQKRYHDLDDRLSEQAPLVEAAVAYVKAADDEERIFNDPNLGQNSPEWDEACKRFHVVHADMEQVMRAYASREQGAG